MNGNHQDNQNSGNEVSMKLMMFFTHQISHFVHFSIKDTSIVQPRIQHQIVETTIHAPYEIYHEEFYKQKHGSPLWFPGPSLCLPLPYCQDGINVGDVEIIQIDEPFNFLFNIFLPTDNLINSKGVPDSFQPLGECDISEVTSDMRGGSARSLSVCWSVHSEPS